MAKIVKALYILLGIIIFLVVAGIVLLYHIINDSTHPSTMQYETIEEFQDALGKEIQVPPNKEIYFFEVDNVKPEGCMVYVVKSGGGFKKLTHTYSGYFLGFQGEDFGTDLFDIAVRPNVFDGDFDKLVGEYEIDGIQCSLKLDFYESDEEERYTLYFTLGNVKYSVEQSTPTEIGLVTVEEYLKIAEPLIRGRYVYKT